MLPIAILAGATLVCASPHVHDGDTITCAGRQVRLWGMDAPELDASPRCGRRQTWACDGWAMRWGVPARDRLIQLTRGEVRCEEMDTDQYRRVVARCEAGGLDLGGQLVADGLARDYPYFSHGRYLSEETRARRGRIGMWVAKGQ